MIDVRDPEGAPLRVGVRVRTGNAEGTVTKVMEPESDTDHYGRDVSVGPFVVVQYDDGAIEHWVAQDWGKQGQLDHYVCHDVEVVP